MSAMIELHTKNGAVMTERNGVSVPASYDDAAAAHQALRRNILLADYSHYGMVEVAGDGAFDFLERTLAGDLASVRDEQALDTLLLNQDGEIVTDLYALCDDERYLLLAEWMSGAALAERLQAEAGDDEVEIRPVSYSCFLLEGPYSWELAAELFGLDVLGLPFLEFMHIEDGILLRGGRHGEYAYNLLIDSAAAPALWERIREAGQKFDLRVGGLEFQRLARLENPCWNPLAAGQHTRCPAELQLQWAVRYDKDDFIGKDALLARLERGVERRVVGVLMQTDASGVAAGDPVYYQDQVIGELVNVGYSPERKAHVGQALLQRDFAYAGVALYHVKGAEGEVPVVTSGAPFINNFSFAVSPTEHSYVDPSRPKSLEEQFAQAAS